MEKFLSFCMSNEIVKIYDLKKEQEYIHLVQKGIVEARDARDKLFNKLLIDKYGLFGSLEWWNAIKTGIIPVYAVEGVITRLYVSGHNDFPEMQIDDGHEKTTWMRQGKDEMYEVGRKIKIKYFLQKTSRQFISSASYPYKRVLEIWVSLET